MTQPDIQPIPLVGEDDRGSNYQWECFRTGTFTLCYRNAGSSSGQHYHQGSADYKNPEIMYLLSGTAELHWCPLNESEIRMDIVKAPAKVVVPINIWHQLIAVTDCSFMELNTLDDVMVDSIRVWREDFLAGKR